MDGLHFAAYVTASVTAGGFLVVAFKLVVAIGRMVSVVEKMPEEMEGIRKELRKSSESSQHLLQNHGERIAVVEAMLDLDDTAQAKEGPRLRRRGRGGREV